MGSYVEMARALAASLPAGGTSAGAQRCDESDISDKRVGREAADRRQARDEMANTVVGTDTANKLRDCRRSIAGSHQADIDLEMVGPGASGPTRANVLRTPEAILHVLPGLQASPMLGLDIETAGVDARDPRTGRIRLVQLATRDAVYVIDAFAVDMRLLAPLFAGTPVFVGHNLAFELGFLHHAGLPIPGRLFDTMLAAQLLGASAQRGKRPTYTLQAVAQRLLDITLDKTEQTSDWSQRELSPAQLRYAALDAAIMLPLYERLVAELEKAAMRPVAELEMRALPAVAWLEQTGAPFDQEAWRSLADTAQTDKERAERELASLVAQAGLDPKEVLAQAGLNPKTLLAGDRINWGSPKQIQAVLAARGYPVESTDEATLQRLASDGDALTTALLRYRNASKRVGTYGLAFLKHVHARTGRVHAGYWQIGAESGRMSCTAPNLQNIPRDPAYRRCFRPPQGRVLIKADYSQIELRLAAQISRDERMIAAYQRGEDLHKLTASQVLGIPETAVTAEHRQLAKSLNFGLVYGMGADKFSAYAASEYGVSLSVQEATRLRHRFFQAYHGLRDWQRVQGNGPGETRTMIGRRRLDVRMFTEKLNTPVQGSGADGLKAALALLWETRDRAPSAAPVLCVHDEIVVECDAATAEQTKEWLVGCMVVGMETVLRAVPVVVEATICPDWSAKAS